MAYAAVISLKQTLQQILLHPRRYSKPCRKKHIKSFHEKLEFLQHFLEEYPSTHKTDERVASLERRIRDAAYESQDFMDLQLKDLFDSKNLWSVLTKARKDFTNLIYASSFVELIKKIDSIIGEVIEIKEQMEIKRGRGSVMEEELETGKVCDFETLNASHKDSYQIVSSDTKNSMVGFDDLLMQIKDQLTGQSSALEVISIVGMGGIGSLPNLEVLKLKDHACDGTEWETNEEEFCELKVLVLERLELKHWKADSNHFPSLRRLIIRWCDDLVEIPSEMGESPTLTTIELCKCNASVTASANEILEKQRDYGNDAFQVIDDHTSFQHSKRGIIRAGQAIRKFGELVRRKEIIRDRAARKIQETFRRRNQDRAARKIQETFRRIHDRY